MTLRRFIILIFLGFYCTLASSQDAGLVINNESIKTITGYFSSSYKEAREKFLKASHDVGVNLEHFRNPETGIDGSALFMDVVLIGSKNAKNFLVLGSGTHGVEGFAGSAVQTGLLQQNIFKDLGPDTSVLMIHAINPYGFEHLRRWNEDNVDLNRNFIDYSSNTFPDNSGYEQLANVINPESLSFWVNIKACIRLFWYGLTHGTEKLTAAISKGQYTHPKGIFFSGTSETWSNKTIRIIAERYLANAEKVIFIDFHTGLGSYGAAEIILNENEYSPAYKRSLDWWGQSVKTTADGESVSIHLQETLKLAFPKMLPDAEVTAVSLEFGTLSAIRVFWALREENWLYHHADKSHPDWEKIKNNLLRAFYPDSDEWKKLVWKQGKEVIEQALVYLK